MSSILQNRGQGITQGVKTMKRENYLTFRIGLGRGINKG